METQAFDLTIIENIESSILSFDEPFADSSQVLTYILSKKVIKKIIDPHMRLVLI